MDFFSDAIFLQWMDTLSDENLVVIDDFLPEPLFEKAIDLLHKKQEEDAFKKAALGDAFSRQVISEIRGDFAYWLDKKRDTELNSFFLLVEELISKLNRYCYLSLSGYEFHLTHYPKGSYYKKHLDQFKDRNNRLISVLIYLNQNWKEGDGGELKVYEKEGSRVIKPIANRCVIFKSDVVEHEVLPTEVSRYSLTGWLLYMPSGVGYILS